ncbi:MAG: alpha-glucan family phosphorylase [Desulfovibrionaceae bacterium]
MRPLKSFSAVPRLPEGLAPLWDLAYNCWFAWTHEIANIFSTIDHPLWATCRENPVAFLNRVPQHVLQGLAQDDFFLQRLDEAHQSLKTYLAKEGSSTIFRGLEQGKPAVGYFSLEYGIAACLPIYSGGLGILAGDHLKSASDLNLPLVGMGLCYREGYFRQYMTPDGWQQEKYPDYDFEELPLRPVKDESGNRITIEVDLAGQLLRAQVWKVMVGRIDLYLLDANIPENTPELRQITSRLYGGDLEMRLRQEILLGIGGVRLLNKLGLSPMVVHMNEGHCAFAALERIRLLMSMQGLSFEAAQEMTASTSVFTTHTPVPAGNDRFSPDLMARYFESYARELGLSFKVFLALGREEPRNDQEFFCMTVLALRLSRFNNGVSQLHGRVSRNMWKRVWPQFPVEDVPIGAITNGVHMPTWVAADLALVYDRYLGSNWREDPDCARVWNNADSIPDAELWRTHERLRERLVDFVRKRLRRQLLDKGARARELQVAEEVLDPRALTIGFARRFATYKRADILLKDEERLIKLVTNKDMPVQFIFAGKAHPADNDGKRLIQKLIELCRREDTRYSMVFLEDYDIKIAMRMVQGCDVWLNTPRRPLEACGTSGMKAMANGVLQLSTLDGWWDEAYRKDNSLGFAVGMGEEYEDPAYQDFVESQTLYTVLESDILPEFYDRGHGNLPRNWVRKMKKALGQLGPIFNAHRMVEDYSESAYLSAYINGSALCSEDFAQAKDLASWRMDLMTQWGGLAVRNVRSDAKERIYVEEPISVWAEVYLNGVSPENVRVESYHGLLDKDGIFSKRRTSEMVQEKELGDGWRLYHCLVQPKEAGRFGFTVRIMPNHPHLPDPHSLGLIYWA